MESTDPPQHHHVYLQSVPCDLVVGDYIVSVDEIDDFQSIDNLDICPSLIIDFNGGDPVPYPCPYTSGFNDPPAYASFIKESLAIRFLGLGFSPRSIYYLMKELTCFIVNHRAWRHQYCPSQPQGHRSMSVPHISINHVSLVSERLNEGATPRVKRATDESIEALEELKGDQRNGSCVVCLENMEVELQEKIVRMPCSHVFHNGCIVEWLKNSFMCPLCRFELPFMEV